MPDRKSTACSGWPSWAVQSVNGVNLHTALEQFRLIASDLAMPG